MSYDVFKVKQWFYTWTNVWNFWILQYQYYVWSK